MIIAMILITLLVVSWIAHMYRKYYMICPHCYKKLYMDKNGYYVTCPYCNGGKHED